MQHKPYGIYEKIWKRPLDFFCSLFASIILSPIMLITAFLVKVKIGSPVLFKQDRPGRNGRIFTLYKFRSMTNQTNEKGELLPDSQRLIPFGKKLRSSSLDELPELFNILKGDMSIVGPRPLMVKYLQRYNSFQMRRNEVRPGFTGLAQIHGRNETTWDERFSWDIKYVDRITLRGDIQIIMKTIVMVLKHEGINAEGEATMSEFMGSDNGE